jgi:phosphodiesterase/alkaline phosphatase D-like protein
LTNLKPNTTYHYEIESRGGKDRFKGSFKTP